MADARADHYARTWNLGGLRLMTQTNTSTLWHCGTGDVLKVLTPVGVRDEAAGRYWLRWADGQGAVTLRASTHDAQLLSYCAGPSALDLPDDVAVDVICDVVSAFPDKAAPEGLTGLKERFGALLSDNGTYRHARAAQGIARKLLESQQTIRPLHGDIHHENILKDGARWLAIDPKGLLGDPAYDVANLFCNPVSKPQICQLRTRVETLTVTLASRLGLCPHRVICFAYAHAALSAIWSVQDGGSPDHELIMADIMAPLAQEAANAIFP